MTLFDLIGRGGPYAFSDHDLAVLADWAHTEQKETPNSDWKRAYALIREGADLLLRRRARSSTTAGIPVPKEEADQPAFGLTFGLTDAQVDIRRTAKGEKRCGKLMCHEPDCFDCYPKQPTKKFQR